MVDFKVLFLDHSTRNQPTQVMCPLCGVQIELPIDMTDSPAAEETLPQQTSARCGGCGFNYPLYNKVNEVAVKPNVGEVFDPLTSPRRADGKSEIFPIMGQTACACNEPIDGGNETANCEACEERHICNGYADFVDREHCYEGLEEGCEYSGESADFADYGEAGDSSSQQMEADLIVPTSALGAHDLPFGTPPEDEEYLKQVACGGYQSNDRQSDEPSLSQWCSFHPVATLVLSMCIAAFLTLSGLSITGYFDKSEALENSRLAYRQQVQLRQQAEADASRKDQLAQQQAIIARRMQQQVRESELAREEAQLRADQLEQERIAAVQQSSEAQADRQQAELARISADQARVKAEQRAQIAAARQLVVDARRFVPKQPQYALALACKAAETRRRAGLTLDAATEQLLRAALAKTGTMQLAAHGGGIRAMTLDADRGLLIAGSDGGTLSIFDLSADDPASKSILLDAHRGPVTTLHVTSGGRWLVSTGDDRRVLLWALDSDLAKATPIELLGHRGQILTSAVSPDGRWLVTAGGALTRPLPEVEVPRAATEIDNSVVMKFAIDTQVSESTVDSHIDSFEIRLWDLHANHPGASGSVLRGHADTVRQVAFSHRGNRFASVSDDREMRVWELDGQGSARPVAVGQGHQGTVRTVVPLDEGRWVTGGHDGSLRHWNVRPDDTVDCDTICDQLGWVTALAVSPDGRWVVASAYDRSIRAWDMTVPPTERTAKILHGHSDAVCRIFFAKDGAHLYTGSMDRTVRCWQMGVNGPIDQPKIYPAAVGPVGAMALSNDSGRLYLGTSNVENVAGLSIQVWNLDPQRLLEEALATVRRYMNPTTYNRLIGEVSEIDTTSRPEIGIEVR